MLTPQQRAGLRAHLIASGISGNTKTTRENSVRNARLLVDGDPDKMLGLSHEGLDIDEAMNAVAALCGCDPNHALEEGPGVIDPDLTIDALERYAERLGLAARNQESVLICTGHPTGPLAVYTAVARALEAAGCKLPRPLDDTKLTPPPDHQRHRGNRVRFIDGVGLYADGASLYHTHAAWPMEQLLDVCDPDLVLADHGFAGAAIARGIETLAFNDINDPSLAVARFRGMVEVVVPIDDNLPSDRYAPLGAVLLEAIAAATGR